MFPKEWRKRSDWKSTTRPFLVESSMRVLCFHVCSSSCGAIVGARRELDSLMCFSRKPLDIEVSQRSVMRDTFLISRNESVNKRWHDASITLSYLVKCVSCTRTIPSHVVFPVSMCCCLCSSRTVCFFISTFVLGGVATSRWWKSCQLLISSVLKQLFLSSMNCVLFLLPLVWHARCATRGRIQMHWR